METGICTTYCSCQISDGLFHMPDLPRSNVAGDRQYEMFMWSCFYESEIGCKY